MEWATDARPLWVQFYNAVSEDQGLLGAATGRAEATTMRLAMIYALLDQSREIRREHLGAAIALWDYAATPPSTFSVGRSEGPSRTSCSTASEGHTRTG